MFDFCVTSINQFFAGQKTKGTTQIAAYEKGGLGRVWSGHRVGSGGTLEGSGPVGLKAVGSA